MEIRRPMSVAVRQCCAQALWGLPWAWVAASPKPCRAMMHFAVALQWTWRSSCVAWATPFLLARSPPRIEVQAGAVMNTVACRTLTMRFAQKSSSGYPLDVVSAAVVVIRSAGFQKQSKRSVPPLYWDSIAFALADPEGERDLWTHQRRWTHFERPLCWHLHGECWLGAAAVRSSGAFQRVKSCFAPLLCSDLPIEAARCHLSAWGSPIAVVCQIQMSCSALLWSSGCPGLLCQPPLWAFRTAWKASCLTMRAALLWWRVLAALEGALVLEVDPDTMSRAKLTSSGSQRWS